MYEHHYQSYVTFRKIHSETDRQQHLNVAFLLKRIFFASLQIFFLDLQICTQNSYQYSKLPTGVWIMFIRSFLIIWTYSITLTLLTFFPCSYNASIAINVPVLPTPALKWYIERQDQYDILSACKICVSLCFFYIQIKEIIIDFMFQM